MHYVTRGGSGQWGLFGALPQCRVQCAATIIQCTASLWGVRSMGVIMYTATLHKGVCSRARSLQCIIAWGREILVYIDARAVVGVQKIFHCRLRHVARKCSVSCHRLV